MCILSGVAPEQSSKFLGFVRGGTFIVLLGEGGLTVSM